MRKNINIRWPEGRLKSLTLSYDDGCVYDKKMIEILDRHGIKCTFNLNNPPRGNEEKIYPEEYKEVYKNHEIAVHGKNHVFMKNVPAGTLVDEVIANRIELEKATGRIVQGMAYPYGPYNDAVIEILKDCGIKYSRTTPRTDSFALPEDWYAWKGTAHNNDRNLFELCDKFLEIEEPEESWRTIDGRLFYLWGHSYEFGRPNDWSILEKFCEKMGGHKDIWYATNIEIYDYVQAFNNLEFNVALTKVYNPTSTDVWFIAGKDAVFVKAGDTVNF